MIIQGVNNPSNAAFVDTKGRVFANAVSNSEQDQAATDGNSYNLNTAGITLTDDAETPVFYLKNESEGNPIKVSRVFMAFGASTGGAGIVEARVIKNLTSGTILTAADLTLSNFNFGIGKEAGAIAKLGGTGETAVGTDTSIRFLFTGDSQRHLIAFDSIILPQGASMALLFKPPVGNTSMIVESGLNFFTQVSE